MRTSLSCPAVASWRPSGENAMAWTAFLCALNVITNQGVALFNCVDTFISDSGIFMNGYTAGSAGLQYDFNKQAGIRGEWERYRFTAFNTGTNTDLLSVGFNYKFY